MGTAYIGLKSLLYSELALEQFLPRELAFATAITFNSALDVVLIVFLFDQALRATMNPVAIKVLTTMLYCMYALDVVTNVGGLILDYIVIIHPNNWVLTVISYLGMIIGGTIFAFMEPLFIKSFNLCWSSLMALGMVPGPFQKSRPSQPQQNTQPKQPKKDGRDLGPTDDERERMKKAISGFGGRDGHDE